MRITRLRSWIRGALAAVCLGPLAASASPGMSIKGCATRDLQILMLIEEREGANAISAQKMIDAMFAMMHARMVCLEGRVLDALALYDGISQSITTDTVQSGRRRFDPAGENQPGVR